MSDPGIAPTTKISDGAQAYQKLLSGGFSAEEANGWRTQQTQKLMGAGFSQPEIDAYWGDKNPGTGPVDNLNRGNPGIHEATNPLEMFLAGLQMSDVGLALHGKPTTVSSQNASLLGKVSEALGQGVGDLPATIAGFVGGAAGGGAAGGAAGAAVPGLGETGISEAAGAVVGGVVGGGTGAAALPEAIRQTLLDYYDRGEIHTWNDFFAVMTKSLVKTAKAGLTGGIAAPVGGVVGGKLLAAGAKPFLATGANLASQAVTATAVGARLDGHAPNQDDFVAGAVLALGFHAAGKMTGALGGQRFVPNEASRRVQSNLQDVYRRLGIPPWQAVQQAKNDPVMRQEILAQDVQGNPATPNFNRSAPDEPALPAKRPVFGGAPKAANENPAIPIDDLLLKVKGLEGSGDKAISPAGAIGRFQIMPGTARQYGFDPERLTDPAYNEGAARSILEDLHRRFRGDEDAILAAYNAGPGRAAALITSGPGTRLEATKGPHGWTYERVDAPRSEAKLPMETQEYLARGRAMGGKEPNPFDSISANDFANNPPEGLDSADNNINPRTGKSPLIVARRLPNGTIKYGKPGEIHSDLIGEGENPGAEDAGFATGPGKPFMSRAEAKDYINGGGGGAKPPGGEGGGGGEPPKQIPDRSNSGEDPMSLNTEMRVSRYLDSVGEPPTGHRSILSGFEMELDAARRVDNQLKTQGLLDPKTDIGIEDMARSTYGSENRANHFFFRGPMDPITFEEKPGLSLKDVADEIQRVGGNKDEFNAYRVSMRTIEKAKQGIDVGVIPGGLKEAEVNAADPNLQKYAKANEMMQTFKRGVLEYVRDSGGISQKQMDAMEAANTSHVSLRRIMGDDVPFRGGKGFKANNPIFRMEGSDRQIVDPWQADIDNARMMIKFADRNRAAGAVASLSKQGLEQIGVKQLPRAQVKATLAEPGSNTFKPYDLSDKEAEGFKPFVREAEKGSANTFTYYKDGKPQVFEATDPNLARLFRAADSPAEATLISKALQVPAKIARYGIAMDPSFGPRIALKHQITAFIADPSHPPPFITMLRGSLDAFGKGDAFWELARTGGLSGSLADMDKNVIQSDAQKLLDETGVSKRVWNTVTSPLQLAQILSDRLSMASRIGYYKRATEQGTDSFKAAMNARKAYLDYDEQFLHSAAQTWAKYVPFFKADVLGLKQGWDAVQPGRIASTAVFATLGLVFPSIALYVANRKADESLPDGYKYTDLPQWQRDLYFTTPPIGGTRFRLGKPYNFGPLLGVPLERFLEHEYENNPHAFDHMFGEMTEMVPVGLPPAVNPIIEGATGYSFFAGKPLVPDSLKDASGDLQYTEATTEPAKAIARLLGPHQGGMNLSNVSPIVIDNYVSAWTGTLGMDLMRAVGAPFKTSSQPWQMSDIPFVHSFVVRNPQTSAQEIQDFYEDLKPFQEKHANTMLALARGDMNIVMQDNQGQIVQRMAKISGALKMMRSFINGVNDNDKMTNDEKQQNIDRTVADMIQLSKTGSKMLQGLK